MTLIYFCFVMGQYGLTLWMPTLIRASGVTSNVTIGLLGAIPFICAIIAMVIFSRSADHYRERRWHLVVPALLGAVGFVVAASATNTTVSIIFLSMAAAGVLACAPLFWSLPTAILSGAAAAAGIALINSVANLAGFISPYMVGIIRDATHSSELGMYVLAGFLILVLQSCCAYLQAKSTGRSVLKPQTRDNPGLPGLSSSDQPVTTGLTI